LVPDKFPTTERRGLIAVLAILSAMPFAAAFPPIHLPWLSWIALVPLFILLRGLTPRTGFIVGWLWAFGVGCGTAFFIPAMFENYFHLSASASLAASLAAILVPGIAYAFFGLWLAARGRWGPIGPFEIAGIWGGVEWCRATLGIANPWSLSGYSQATVLPMLQGASLLGVIGLGMIIALGNASLVALFPRFRPTHPLRTAALVAGTLLAWVVYGFHELRISPTSNPVTRIALVQASLPPSERVLRSQRDSVLGRHLELSRFAVQSGAELIFWPEYALEHRLEIDPTGMARIARFTRESKTALVFGTIGESKSEQLRDSGPVRLHNTTLLSEDGFIRGRYDKFALLPFGETRPLGGLIGGHVSGILPGMTRAPLQTRSLSIGVLTCSEIMSAEASRATVHEGAQLLANLANDEWLGPIGMRQQLMIATVRAVENRRFLARATHSGITAMIDPQGRIFQRAEEAKAGVLVGDIEARNDLSTYTRFGDWPVLALAGLALTRSAFSYRSFRRRAAIIHGDSGATS